MCAFRSGHDLSRVVVRHFPFDLARLRHQAVRPHCIVPRPAAYTFLGLLPGFLGPDGLAASAVEPHAGRQFALVPPDLRHHPPQPVPALSLVKELIVPDDRPPGRAAYGTRQERLDLAPEHFTGQQANGVP